MSVVHIYTQVYLISSGAVDVDSIPKVQFVYSYNYYVCATYCIGNNVRSYVATYLRTFIYTCIIILLQYSFCMSHLKYKLSLVFLIYNYRANVCLDLK